MSKPKTHFIVACILLCAASVSSTAQGIFNQRLDFEARDLPIGPALLNLSRASGVIIGFSEAIFEKPVRVNFSARNERLSVILDALLESTGTGWRESGGQVLLFKKTPPEISLYGFVEDAESGERLAGAVVADLTHGHAVRTNGYGFFSLSIPAGEDARLAAHFLGFEKVEIKVSGKKAAQKPLFLALKPRADLAEVVIFADSTERSSLTPVFTKKEENLMQVPLGLLTALGGEPDLMRGAALLPGIGSSVDGLGGWSVRGGDLDQNRMVVDDALVFNPGHGLGLFSIVSPSAVRSAQIWKGDAPARLGGSAASILEVRTREGNVFRPAAAASLGWLAGEILLEMPLKNERGAVLFSGRKSFVSPIFKIVTRRDPETDGVGGESDYTFSDAHFKINWSFDARNRLFLSLFATGDRFSDSLSFSESFASDSLTTFDFSVVSNSSDSWRNRFAALRWNHIFSEKCFANTTLTASRFYLRATTRETVTFDGDIFETPEQSLSQTDLRDFSVKTDLDWLPGENLVLRAGAQFSRTDVLPFYFRGAGQFPEWAYDPDDAETLSPGRDLQFESGLTLAGYGETEFSPRQDLRFRLGFRGEVYINAEKTRFLPQPRLYAEKKWRNGFSNWLSFHSMAQTLRTVSPNTIESLGDLWLLASEYLPPQRAHQVGAGVGWERRDWALRLDFFAKKMTNIEEYFFDWTGQDTVYYNDITYQNGIRQWENEIETGRGRAFGAEFFAEKKSGRTTGWLALTLGRSERKFEKLSRGRWFPARFDRLVNLKIAAIHRFSDRFSVSAVWQFASGDAISRLLIFSDAKNPRVRLVDLHRGNFPVTRFGNGDFRQSAQHHLDVSLQYQWKKGRFEQAVSLGVYNVYRQKNRHFTYWRVAETNGFPAEVETPVFGLPFLPHLTWRGSF